MAFPTVLVWVQQETESTIDGFNEGTSMKGLQEEKWAEFLKQISHVEALRNWQKWAFPTVPQAKVAKGNLR